MTTQDFINRLNKIDIGFSTENAVKKINVALELVYFLKKNYQSISDKDIQKSLEWIYGVYYESGNIKQSLDKRPDFYLIKKTLPIARTYYKKTQGLLPFLYANMQITQNKDVKKVIKKEIEEIKNKLN